MTVLGSSSGPGRQAKGGKRCEQEARGLVSYLGSTCQPDRRSQARVITKARSRMGGGSGEGCLKRQRSSGKED